MKRIALLTLALLAFLPAPQPATAGETVELGDVVKALEDPFKTTAKAPAAIVDFQADFVQESHIASLDRLQQGRGRVAVKFDRSRAERVALTRFRWEYDQPTPQEIVSNGHTIWVYLPESQQVIQTDIDLSAETRPDDPLTFLTALGNLSRDFRISWAEPSQDAKGNYVLELRPRHPSAMIQRLLVVVRRDAVDATRRGKTGSIFPILSTTVFDPSENRTHIEFSNVRVNRGVPDTLFDFTPPAGVEVVRPTGQEKGF